MAVLEERTVFFMASYHSILHYACQCMVSHQLSRHKERHYPTDELDVQFDPIFISSVIWNINAEILAKTFMEEVALSSGMTAVIVVDVDRKFRSVFDDMCAELKSTYGHLLS